MKKGKGGIDEYFSSISIVCPWDEPLYATAMYCELRQYLL
jgi:hypothetical protein